MPRRMMAVGCLALFHPLSDEAVDRSEQYRSQRLDQIDKKLFSQNLLLFRIL